MPYILNGQQVNLNESPFLHDGRNFIPLEDVSKSLGGTVTFDNATKTASVTIAQWTARVQNGNPTVDVNGTKVNISDPPYIENDTMYVPWSFFRDAFGYKASMENDTLIVHL